MFPFTVKWKHNPRWILSATFILSRSSHTSILKERNIKLWMNRTFRHNYLPQRRATLLFSQNILQLSLTAPYGELNHQNYSSNKNLSIQKTTPNQTTIAQNYQIQCKFNSRLVKVSFLLPKRQILVQRLNLTTSKLFSNSLHI